MPLPIDTVLPELSAALARTPRAVLVAAPGAGKTTRVPLALLREPWRKGGKIVMLEPRRLAARAAATFMARSLGEPVGQTVGYRVRFETRVSKATRIEIVTEGVFTRMLLDDPELKGIDAVIFDEFHERSLDADLGLALALDAAQLRPELRLLVMSATLDGAKVATLLGTGDGGSATVIESEGRAYPIETRYAPPDPQKRLEDQVADAVVTALRADGGSILVFLPGQGEISRTAELLRNRVPADVDISPLYGQLATVEQDRAIVPAPAGRRKIVLATSIAETSLTIEGIRIVVDSGFRRLPVYDPATGLTSLVTRRISRAAADQRRGRAGRTAPGIAWRLWTEGQTAGLEPFDTPEILAADLTGLVLDLASWGVIDPAALRFLDSPPRPAWAEAVALLQQLDALDANGRITPEGKLLTTLPLHPRLAHMVQRSDDPGTAAELAVLITEHGLGGDDTDLGHRLSHFRQDQSRRAADARAMARRWSGTLPAGGTALGPVLALAYPDRVAQRAGAPGRYRLANGRAASLEASDVLASHPFLAVSEVTGTAANGRIRTAAPLSRDDIEALFASHITVETTLQWDTASASVRARRRRMYQALLLTDDPVPVPHREPDLSQAADILAQHIVDRLPWAKDQRELLDLVAFLRKTVGDPWPDLSSFPWQDVANAVHGRTSLAEVRSEDLDAVIGLHLTWQQIADAQRALPAHFVAPTGTRAPIDYTAEAGPSISIRVQELFGLDTHPAVAQGKVPLTLVLLSPAYRPIQTTRDLPGFWRGSWKDVLKEMRGRYPKHVWPDDPVGTRATTRAKPRGT